MFRVLKCKSGTLSQCVFVKMLTNDIKNDQKIYTTNTKDSISHDKSSKAKKLILELETTKLSTRMQKCRRLHRMWLEKNMEKQLESLERSQKDLSNDINNSKIGDWMLKICLQECKTELLTA